MEGYRLVFKQSVAKDLRRIPKADLARILERIAALADDPHPADSEKLSAQPRYRLRQGVDRIVYAVDDADKTVITVKVAHRRDVYRSS